MKISSANLNAIKQADRAGVKVVLATGRPLNGIKAYLKLLGLDKLSDYAIVLGGAVVQGTSSGEVIERSTLGMSDWDILYSLSRKLGVDIQILTQKTCITPKLNRFSRMESEVNGIPLIIGDPGKLEPEPAIAKIMFVDEPEIIRKVALKIPEEVYDRYTVVSSSPCFLEFLNKNANKGLAVKQLADNLDITQDEIICIGDEGNDMHMIEYAGLGVAMGNAIPKLKQAADYVTLTNENDGVAHVINKFIFNKTA